MKKTVVALLIVALLVPAAFAQKSTSVKASAKASSAKSFGVGVAGFSQAGAMPTIKFNLSDTLNMQAGLGVVSAAGATNMNLMAAINGKIGKVGGYDLFTGGRLGLASAAGATTTMLNWDLGIEFMANDSVEVGMYITPFSFSSAAGASSFSILNTGLLISAHLFI